MVDVANECSWRETFMRFAPLILWIGVIFFLSSDQGSMAETSRFIRPLLQFLFPAASDGTIQIYHGYIRKAAHVTEYGVLALIAYRACSLSAGAIWRRYRFVLPVILVAVIASIDEFNQSFEPSRTSSPYDVLLDISGGVAALIALRAIFFLKK
jgi:VanZ family protein